MTSQMWLGSDFCARHILRNFDHLAEILRFWTREQTGSEACPWLLFEHKHAYLRATRDRFDDSSLARMFCIPQRRSSAHRSSSAYCCCCRSR